jgi:signal transduction histidine kinase
MDLSQLLIENIDTIIENWVEAVRQDSQIESTSQLTYKAVQDGVPRILEAIATVLSQTQDSDIQTLVKASLEHGVVRAEQGFDPAEIAREYHLLRWVIFTTLERELLQTSPVEMLRAVRLIDTAIDEAITRCFQSYTQGRLQELEQLQTQLQLNNQELTRLVCASKTNLSQLAHELKTPLTSIIGYSDLFLRQQRKHAELKDRVPNLESIERVLHNGRQLLHLINEALEISRYEAGKMRPQLAPINVPMLIKQAIEMVQPLADAKALQLLVKCDCAPEQVLTDPLRLQQIVTNLLSNAIRYTASGSVQLECQTLTNTEWMIAVIDTGIGIEPENQTRIFEPYFRGVPHEESSLFNSTGLGLAIVSRLVKLLQGKIELVSQVGMGSTFTVILPLEIKEPEVETMIMLQSLG